MPAPAIDDEPQTPPGPQHPPATRRSQWWAATRSRYTANRADKGMSTAEYAVGTIAACAFAALLFKVVSSPEIQEALSNLIDQALNTAG
ncbi:DUF4244 domain-containing protein [Nonomuraea sp. NBC_01738]|uniref:DUF4244 domain-containing protein n=1 Tax=Nonomuraea sp. NBC_01738 TaxID=2976003 RepID=UPI002E14ED10|nr:DUF4244 domain-containing protein [Nonomuraea sp. NBC_01738]